MWSRSIFVAGSVLAAALAGVAVQRAAAQEAEEAHIRVRVPADADVWFSGEPTAQTGTVRDFVTPELNPNNDYHYMVRARWRDKGKQFDQTRKVPVYAGDYVTVDFRKPPPPPVVERVIERQPVQPVVVSQPPPATNNIFITEPASTPKTAQAALVRVRVPDANAEVWLSGHKTLSKGVSREFTTKSLQPDKNYSARIRAKWSDNGVQVEQTREVNLFPGDRITVDFTRPEPKPNE